MNLIRALFFTFFISPSLCGMTFRTVGPLIELKIQEMGLPPDLKEKILRKMFHFEVDKKMPPTLFYLSYIVIVKNILCELGILDNRPLLRAMEIKPLLRTETFRFSDNVVVCNLAFRKYCLAGDGVFNVYDASFKQAISLKREGIANVYFSDDGSLLATTGDQMCIWDLNSGYQICSWRVSAAAQKVFCFVSGNVAVAYLDTQGHCFYALFHQSPREIMSFENIGDSAQIFFWRDHALIILGDEKYLIEFDGTHDFKAEKHLLSTRPDEFQKICGSGNGKLFSWVSYEVLHDNPRETVYTAPCKVLSTDEGLDFGVGWPKVIKRHQIKNNADHLALNCDGSLLALSAESSISIYNSLQEKLIKNLTCYDSPVKEMGWTLQDQLHVLLHNNRSIVWGLKNMGLAHLIKSIEDKDDDPT